MKRLFSLKNNKRVLRGATALLLVFTVSLLPSLHTGATSIESLQEQVNDIQEQRTDLQGNINDTKSKITTLLAEISVLEEEIAENEGRIEEAELEIASAEEAELRQYEAMKKRMKFMYENGNKSLIEIFVESSGFADFLNRIEYINAVYDSDRDMMDAYEATKIEIEGMKEELESEKAELESEKSTLDAKKSSLDSTLASLKSKMVDVDAALADAKQDLAAAIEKKRKEEEERRRKAAEEAARRAAAAEAARRAAAAAAARNNSNSSGSSSSSRANGEVYDAGGSYNPSPVTNVSGSSVVSYAKQFVGNPYVWGGNSLTNGCDCSGFVVQVYKNFGIDLSGSRNSYALRSVGQKVSYDNIQPGDIVCYAGHVAIYAGGGVIVEAQSTRTGITYGRSVLCHNILAIRRVI